MKILEITQRESLKQNLETWALEKGTRFEKHNVEAAEEFLSHLAARKRKATRVLELGCGDGIALKMFHDAGYHTTGVDINNKKLCMIEAGPKIVRADMLEFLTKDTNFIDNIFTHHALEHTPFAPEIILRAGRRIFPGGLWYAVVPAEDYLHSVHHVVFESAEELLPPKFEPIVMEQRERFGEKEFVCIAKKKS